MKTAMRILFATCLLVLACSGQRTSRDVDFTGRIIPCPSSPNCVSSLSDDPEHFVEPFRYTGDKQAAYQRLKNIAAAMERTTIVQEETDYLRIECRSAIMGFVDDVEFSFAQENVIHVRSASRVGYSDFGVNRKRVEDLRTRFHQD
jgi:uncharacterized protein (DUF1499 family)